MTFLTGLLGYPLGHSISPAMHNAAFQALGLDGRYDALPTPPEELAEMVRGLAAAGYRGVNVTIPHKQAVMPLLDELSDAARAIGAVNTIVVDLVTESPVNEIHRLTPQRPLRAWGAETSEPVNEIHRLTPQRPLRAWGAETPEPVNEIHRLTPQRPLRAWEMDIPASSSSPAPEGASYVQPGISIPGVPPPSPAPEGASYVQPGISIPGVRAILRGDNTDWLGFLYPLDARGFDLAGKSALLLGAGGSARAVVYALVQRGLAHLTIWARTPARAAELAAHAQTLAPSLTIHPFPHSPINHSPDLIINTTPLGMWPHVDASPWPADLPIPAGALVYDLVYRPERTLFLRQAEAAGCQTQGGLEMLAVQGAAAFELWTGQKPPLQVMLAAARAGNDARTVLLNQAGALADDEMLPDLLASIYARRGRAYY
ncbi:MAG: shikimate dehydrogenase [Anaerolinea sp.]|nr:shikimate dehydrogenase [Anaerolinea sp.]